MSLWGQISTAVDNQWGNLVKSGEQSLNDFKNVGLPALIESGAQKGIDALTGIKNDAHEQVQNNVNEILQRPGDPNSFFNTYISPALTNAGLKTYGPYILLGVGGVLITGMLLKGGK